MLRRFFLILFLLPLLGSSQQVPDQFVIPLHFQKSTVVRYYLTTGDTVSLSVYNRWKQLILPVYTNSFVPAGDHRDTINMQKFPDEFYVVVLKAGTKTFSKDIVKDEKNVVKELVHWGLYDFQVDTNFMIYSKPGFESKNLTTSYLEYLRKTRDPDLIVTQPRRQISSIEINQLSNISINGSTSRTTDKSKNQIHSDTIYGSVKNNALLAVFSGIEVTVSYYSANGDLISGKNYLLNERIDPGLSKPFKLKIGPPKEAVTFNIEVTGAITGNHYTGTVRKQFIEHAEQMSDLIPDYPRESYDKTIDYVSVELVTTSHGKTVETACVGENLTPEQKNILKGLETWDKIQVVIKYKYKDPFFDDLGGKDKVKEMGYLVRISN